MEQRLSKLPHELQLMVVSEIDDPCALLNLIKASPWAANLFNECYIDVTRAVLSHRLHPQVLQLAFAMLSKRASGYQGMDTFKAAVQPKGKKRNKPIDYPLNVGGHSAEAAKSVLETAINIQKQAWTVLRILLKWTNGLQVFHVQNCESLRRISKVDAEYWRDSSGEPAPAAEYEPAHCWTPSWIEAYRVHRALWRLQLYREHADMQQDERNPFFLARRRNAVSEDVSLGKFWRHIPTWHVTEICCLLEAHGLIDELELEEVELEDPPPKLYTAYPPSDGAIPHGCEVEHHIGDGAQMIEQEGPGYSFLHSYAQGNPRSLLGPTEISILEGRGMAVWDLDRLAGLELLNQSTKAPQAGGSKKLRKRMTQDEMGFTWKMMVFRNPFGHRGWGRAYPEKASSKLSL